MWTVIGVFATSTFGLIGLVSTLFLRIIRSEISGLSNSLLAEIRAIHTRIDHLDRDIQVLFNRAFGRPE